MLLVGIALFNASRELAGLPLSSLVIEYTPHATRPISSVDV